jgi:hypothetical protein
MYNDQEETYWFNHVLLAHFDKQFQTNSYLRLSISISTNNFLVFGQPFLNIQISNSVDDARRSYSLSIQNCTDLVKAFKQIIDNSEQSFLDRAQIIRKYNLDKSIIFTFFNKDDTNEKLVKFQIFHNESNFGAIIIEYSLFQLLAIQIRSFVTDYIKIGGDIRRDFISSRLLQINDKLLKDIRNLPNQLLELPVVNTQPVTDSSKIPTTIENQLDDYIGGKDMSNIKDITLDTNDVDKPIQEKLQEVESKFVDIVLKRDVKNLENFLNSISNTSINPLESIINEFQSLDSDMVLLPGISDKDMKSLVYLSKLFYATHYQNYLENNVSIPLTTSILKYDTNDIEVKPENMELAYDLLTIMGYLKCFRNKIETKESDVYINKSLIYLSFRCFIDVFIFSFLTKKLVRTDVLLSKINSRFKYFNSIGVFDSFKKELENNSFPEVSETEISIFVQQVIEGPIESSPSVDIFHKNSVKQLTVPPDNDFTIEQIINDIIPKEVNEKLGNAVSSVETKNEKSVPKQTTSKSKSNLLKYISSIDSRDEIYIDICKDDKNFDFNNLTTPLEEIDENVIKALYLWNPENDIKVKQNYNYFVSKISDELMTKDLIIAKLRTGESSGDDWEF